MSKSLKYAMKIYPERFSKAKTKEINSIVYLDKFLQGERTQTKETEYGAITTVIEINKNADFNYLNSWSGSRDGFIDDLEEQLYHAAYETLCEKLYVPLEDDKPIGGWPEDGDTIKYTIGNFIVNHIVSVEQRRVSQTLQVALPVKYELIKGKNHEQVDTAT